jgi:hypothetical protein
MNRSQILLTLAIVIIFPIFFGGIWSGVCYLIGAVGGWQNLASKYETAKNTVVDQKFTDEYGKFGVSRYKFTLTVGFSKGGIFFANNPFFRIGHPPMLIPWSAIRIVSNDGLFLHIKADNTDIWLSKKFLGTIQQHLR